MSWRAVAAEVLSEADGARAQLAQPDPQGEAAPCPTPPSAIERCGHNGHTGPLAERLTILRGHAAPMGLSHSRWNDALNRAETLVARWGAQALALGWAADDLLGVDPAAWMRMDRRGAFFVNPTGEVVGITADEVALRMDGRTIQKFRRRVAP